MSQQIMNALQDIDHGLEKYNAKLADLETKNRELAGRLLDIEQKGGAWQDGGHNDNAAVVTLGAKVWREIKANADLLGKTSKLRLDIKAAGDVTGTGSARTIVSGGVGVAAGMALGAQFAFTSRSIGATSAVEYSRYTGIEGAAALQAALDDAKAAVRPTFSLISQPALTIAGYSKISKQALSDQSELSRAIDVTLRRSIGKALDTVLCSGTWGGGAGMLAHATAYTSLVYTSLADAASEGVATMQEAGFVAK